MRSSSSCSAISTETWSSAACCACASRSSSRLSAASARRCVLMSCSTPLRASIKPAKVTELGGCAPGGEGRRETRRESSSLNAGESAKRAESASRIAASVSHSCFCLPHGPVASTAAICCSHRVGFVWTLGSSFSSVKGSRQHGHLALWFTQLHWTSRRLRTCSAHFWWNVWRQLRLCGHCHSVTLFPSFSGSKQMGQQLLSSPDIFVVPLEGVYGIVCWTWKLKIGRAHV